MINKTYELEVLVNGQPAKEYYHDGNVYIEGREGKTFQLKIKNNGNGRITVVPTVDGLSVLDGKEATGDSVGYIINGYSSMTIDGWRKNEKEVAEFYFTNADQAYSAKVGKGGNQGVIGVAIFREKYKMPTFTFTDLPKGTIDTWPKYSPPTWVSNTSADWSGPKGESSGEYRLSSASSTHNAAYNVRSMDAVQFKASSLGTGWGDTKHSAVTEVYFDREAEPDALMAIYYNTRGNLEKLGVKFRTPAYVSTPNPFPKFPSKWCEPPVK